MPRVKSKSYTRQWKNAEVRLGDFLAWMHRAGFGLRMLEDVRRNPDNDGWNWTLGTLCMFVSDKQIRRELPPKSEEDWNFYGR